MKGILALGIFCLIFSARADSTNGLIAYFPFNGHVNDESAYQRTMTNHGAIFSVDRFGNGSVAASFQGTNYMESGNWFTNQVFTISLWVNPEGTQINRACMLDNRHSSEINWVLQQHLTSLNSYYFGSIGGEPPRFVLPTAVWSSMVIVKTTSQTLTFTNGVLFDTAARGLINYDGQQRFNIGRWGRGTVSDPRYFRGSIDDVRIYHRALSSSEVAELYDLEAPPRFDLTNGLLASYRFDGNAHDETGNGNDGVVNRPALTRDRFGNENSAYGFNGTSDYIRVTHRITTNQPFTWLREWQAVMITDSLLAQLRQIRSPQRKWSTVL